jgi:hypothetical protein
MGCLGWACIIIGLLFTPSGVGIPILIIGITLLCIGNPKPPVITQQVNIHQHHRPSGEPKDYQNWDNEILPRGPGQEFSTANVILVILLLGSIGGISYLQTSQKVEQEKVDRVEIMKQAKIEPTRTEEVKIRTTENGRAQRRATVIPWRGAPLIRIE